MGVPKVLCIQKHCNALKHTATHCNTLQRAATHCSRPVYVDSKETYAYRNTAAHCNTVQHTYLYSVERDICLQKHCITLQHTGAHCNEPMIILAPKRHLCGVVFVRRASKEAYVDNRALQKRRVHVQNRISYTCIKYI